MRRPVLAAVISIAVLALAAACGGDDGGNGGEALTLEAYFTEAAAIGAALDDAIEPSVTTFATSEDPEELKAAFGAYPGALDAFIGSFAALAAPDEVAAEHNATIDAAEAFRDELEAANDGVQEATTYEEFLEAADTPDLGTLSDALTETCVTLQGIADENGIEVDLGCEA